MAHEFSETVQDPKTGKWVNVYGRGTRFPGQRLPLDRSGLGHGEYDTKEEAAAAARARSEAMRDSGHESGIVESAMSDMESIDDDEGGRR